MDGTRSSHNWYEKCIHNFGRIIWRVETTCNTYV